MKRIFNPFVLIFSLIVLSVGGVALLALFSSLPMADEVVNSNGDPNIIESPDVTSIADLDLAYFAIKSDDTIFAIAQDGTKVVIKLEKLQWQNLQLSPDGKLLSVLGMTQTERQIYDLFVFEIATQKWHQATQYSQTDSGITGYYWFNDTTIVYTQGVGSDAWLHTYEHANNQILKIYQTEANLRYYIRELENYVLSDNVNITITDNSGKVVHQFKRSEIFTTPGTNVDITLGRMPGELLFIGSLNNTLSYKYWSFDDPVLRDIVALKPAAETTKPTQFELICPQSQTHWWVLGYLPEEKVVLSSFDPVSGDYAQVTELPEKTYFNLGKVYEDVDCNLDQVLLKGSSVKTLSKFRNKWFFYDGAELLSVSDGSLFVEMVANGGE